MTVVSNALRRSARGQNCTLRTPFVCNHNTETTVLAHLPVGMKWVGMKSPDLFAVFACSACHDALDGRSRHLIQDRHLLRALAETQMKWVEMGLITIEGAA